MEIINTESNYNDKKCAIQSWNDEVFTSKLDDLVNKILSLLSDNIKYIDRLIKTVDVLKAKHNVKMFIIGNDLNPLGRLVSIYAKQKNIPTLSIAHGNSTGFSLNGRKVVDKYCIYGKNDYKTLINYGCKKNKLIITGNPSFDFLPKKQNTINVKIKKC